MSATNTFGITFAAGAGQLVAATVAATDINEYVWDGTIGATTTNKLISAAFPYANIQSVFIYSDQAVTLYTNATNGAGGNTFTVTALTPIFWYTGCGYTNPFTANVASIYGNNAGATVANVKVYVVYH